MVKMNYLSINAVIKNIILTLPDEQFNELVVREWITQGLQKVKVGANYITKFFLGVVQNHKLMLPDDIKYLYQIAYIDKSTYSNIVEEIKGLLNFKDERDNPALQYITDPDSIPTKAANLLKADYWKPLRASVSPFHSTITEVESLLYSAYKYTCPECEHSYSIDGNGCLTTSFKEGLVWISYAGYKLDKDGAIMIPDNASLIEALQHYVYYQYWLRKSFIDDKSIAYERKAQYHLSRYGLLVKRAAGELNDPNIDTLENILHQRNRLVLSTRHYDRFFTDLNSKVNE